MKSNQEFVVAIFASGSGTNAEAIMRHFQYRPGIDIALLLSNNPEAKALPRAEKFGVVTKVFSKVQFRESGEVLRWLKGAGVTHVVLAGFLWLIPPDMLKEYPDRIINIHPSLLPRHGGKGMYGAKVHEAVRNAGDLKTGITVHLVNERFDEGKIFFQATCAVDPGDTVEEIANKVHALEHAHYPEIIEQWIHGKLA